MTIAWKSENWNRDREFLEDQRKHPEQMRLFENSIGASLEDWLASRAQHVASHTKRPQRLSQNQQERDIWKAAEEENAGTHKLESNDLRHWLRCRQQRVGVAKKQTTKITAALTRTTFIPDHVTPPLTSSVESTASSHIDSEPCFEVSTPVPPAISTAAQKTTPKPIRLTSGQLFLAMSRLVLEVNWDWFHANRFSFDIPDVNPETSQRWWNNICHVYQEYCRAASQGVDALMKLYQQSKSKDDVLSIEQTVLYPMMYFLVGYKADHSGAERGKAVLKTLLLEGNLLVFVTKWCEENGLEYPGGTGRTPERLKEHGLDSLRKPEV